AFGVTQQAAHERSAAFLADARALRIEHVVDGRALAVVDPHKIASGRPAEREALALPPPDEQIAARRVLEGVVAGGQDAVAVVVAGLDAPAVPRARDEVAIVVVFEGLDGSTPLDTREPARGVIAVDRDALFAKHALRAPVDAASCVAGDFPGVQLGGPGECPI